MYASKHSQSHNAFPPMLFFWKPIAILVPIITCISKNYVPATIFPSVHCTNLTKCKRIVFSSAVAVLCFCSWLQTTNENSGLSSIDRLRENVHAIVVECFAFCQFRNQVMYLLGVADRSLSIFEPYSWRLASSHLTQHCEHSSEISIVERDLSHRA